MEFICRGMTDIHDSPSSIKQHSVDSYTGCSVVLDGDWNVAKHRNYPAESFVSQFCLEIICGG